MVDAATRLLVLGSLPGEESLRQARYYSHPRNQFWRLIGAVIGLDLEPLSYQARLQALLANGIGLWDVIASATRPGSLDAAIRAHQANPIADLLCAQPGIAAIGFNGATSAALGRKALGATTLTLLDLPSSSPAYTLSFETKRAAWLELKNLL